MLRYAFYLHSISMWNLLFHVYLVSFLHSEPYQSTLIILIWYSFGPPKALFPVQMCNTLSFWFTKNAFVLKIGQYILGTSICLFFMCLDDFGCEIFYTWSISFDQSSQMFSKEDAEAEWDAPFVFHSISMLPACQPFFCPLKPTYHP